MTNEEIKLQAARFLAAKPTMSILECEALAKELDTRMRFKLIGPKGELECQWDDPYCGIFHGEKGTYYTMSFQFIPGISCTDIRARP